MADNWLKNESIPSQENTEERSRSNVDSNEHGNALQGQHVISNGSPRSHRAEQVQQNATSDLNLASAERERTPKRRRDMKVKYEHYQTSQARLNTYKKWPVQIVQKPKQLSEAGCFFTGNGDCVCCYVCGGHIYEWGIDDDIWEEHCRLFPLCSLVKEQKGDVYINHLMQAECLEYDSDSEKKKAANGSLCRQLAVRSKLEELRCKMLTMGYEDLVIKKAIIHLRNLASRNPTLEEAIEAVHNNEQV